MLDTYIKIEFMDILYMQLSPELIEYMFSLCSSMDRSILCQVSKSWYTMAINISSKISPMGGLYSINHMFSDEDLYKSGDYHLIVRLKNKMHRFMLYR